ncbi:MAG: hypothetical protein KAI84_02855, partial [Gammaproteobacteria bacterium]|nr:hypothetical protein [Gammaproteobacteria bacterium]
MTRYLLIILSFSILSSCALQKHELPPFADIHLHFNWDHEELLSAKEAVNILEAHNVTLAVVSSVPSHYALKLKEEAGDWIVPFVTPYYHAGNRLNWYFDKTLVGKIRKL